MRVEGVTALLKRWKLEGDTNAEDELFRALEPDFLRIARGALRHSPDLSYKVDPRELMSEAYLRLRDYPVETWGRGPFYKLMSKCMRNFLVDLTRHDHAAKRPPSGMRLLDTSAVGRVSSPVEFSPIDFYRVLDELEAVDPRKAKVVELRVAGLENNEIAQELGIALATVKRDVTAARAFFAVKLSLPANWLV